MDFISNVCFTVDKAYCDNLHFFQCHDDLNRSKALLKPFLGPISSSIPQKLKNWVVLEFCQNVIVFFLIFRLSK